jgi:hypothetical protein
VPKDAIRTA